MRYLYHLVLLLGLCLMATSPAFAQDPPGDEATEAAAEEAPAVEKDAKAPEAEGDEAKAEGGEEAAEGDEKTAEGDEEAAEVSKVPETDEEAIETATALLDALQGKEWPLAVGLLLTLLVYLANKFALKSKVSEKILPFVAGGVGLAGATGVGLVMGEPVVDALIAGALAAVAAVGGWEAVSKLFMKGEAETDKTDPGT